MDADKAVDVFISVVEDEDRERTRDIVRTMATEDLLPLERACVAIVWIARDIRHERAEGDRGR